jgi:hypothetical protein
MCACHGQTVETLADAARDSIVVILTAHKPRLSHVVPRHLETAGMAQLSPRWNMVVTPSFLTMRTPPRASVSNCRYRSLPDNHIPLGALKAVRPKEPMVGSLKPIHLH